MLAVGKGLNFYGSGEAENRVTVSREVVSV